MGYQQRNQCEAVEEGVRKGEGGEGGRWREQWEAGEGGKTTRGVGMQHLSQDHGHLDPSISTSLIKARG